jgi:hypothetical protein
MASSELIMAFFSSRLLHNRSCNQAAVGGNAGFFPDLEAMLLG